MIITRLTILLPFVAIASAYPFVPCNCGLGEGQNVCEHKKCEPMVVRPCSIPKPVLPAPKVVCAPVGGIPPLAPVGSPCSCHTAIVKPAVVPRPPCTVCGATAGCTCSSSHHESCSHQHKQLLYGGTLGGHAPVRSVAPIVVDDHAPGLVNPAHYVPADPVSLHVAYKLAQEANCNLNEDKLAFGFRSIPKELPLHYIKRGNNIPEENLFSLNGQIVELKVPKCGPHKSLDEEAKEQLMQLAEEEAEDALDAGVHNVKHISLGEIGYGPAKIKEPVFINVPAVAGNIPDDGLRQPVKDCHDGFKPGAVAIKQDFLKDHLSLPIPLPEPCADDLYIPPPSSSCSHCTSYLSSSSSSSHASSSYKKGVLFQKLGCN